jgi:antitoxin CcdA
MGIGKPRARKAVTILIDELHLEIADELSIDVQTVCSKAFRNAVSVAWIEQNRPAMEASNAWIAEHGMPLGQYRNF